MSVGTHTVTASVTDSDGNADQDTTTVIIEPNTAPTVSITGGGGTYLAGATVQLQGTASDAEDGEADMGVAIISDEVFTDYALTPPAAGSRATLVGRGAGRVRGVVMGVGGNVVL